MITKDLYTYGRGVYLADVGVFCCDGRAMGSDAVAAVLAGKFGEFGRIWMSGRGVFTWGRRRGPWRGGGRGLAAAVAVVAGAAGVSRATVMKGAGELAEGAGPMPGRERRPGAGRPRAEDAQPGLGGLWRGCWRRRPGATRSSR